MQADFIPADVEKEDRSLAGLWAKKYFRNLVSQDVTLSAETISGRLHTTDKLLSRLRFCSSRAWGKTENLLFDGLQKHRINADYIDPWKIAEDSRLLFEQAFESYQNRITPECFSVNISRQCGQVRQQHTVQDPRILGFLSMQFHFTGQLLLEELSVIERSVVADYFKVMDDHLYMPLQRSYEAAAQHVYESPALVAVRQLLPVSTQIAEYICAQVISQNPGYQCHSGVLSDVNVRTSSIRDIEMFQTYLCLCALEGNIVSVQEELFPLCVMLYPPLKVNWALVRQLLQGLTQEMQRRLTPLAYLSFQPYLKAFQEMFSEKILSDNDPIWSHHPHTIRYLDMARNVLNEVRSS